MVEEDPKNVPQVLYIHNIVNDCVSEGFVKGPRSKLANPEE
jgi:hypothetical protein